MNSGSKPKLKAQTSALSFVLNRSAELYSSAASLLSYPACLRALICLSLILLPLAGFSENHKTAESETPGMAAPVASLLLETTKLQPFGSAPQRGSPSFTPFILSAQVLISDLPSHFIDNDQSTLLNQRRRLLILQKLQLEGG